MYIICEILLLAARRVHAMFWLAVALGSTAGNVTASDWPQLIVPDGTNVVIVSDQIDINRMPTRIWQFHADKKPEQFLAFYRAKWTKPPQEGAPPYIENSTEEWKIISRPEGDFMIAVQVGAKNPLASDGMVSMAQIKGTLVDKAMVARAPEYPKMPGSKVLQELNNHDAGKSALTVILENGNSSSSNRSYYKHFYESRGWTEIGGHSNTSSDSEVLLLQKGPLETSFTFVSKNAKTQVVGSIQYVED
ncbi:MAG: hypothetical protein JWM78_3507 [Verrucomicrobiaceae bacterium]|nr:hypothetical protein [Verrucomicrobiaceae bacterium]